MIIDNTARTASAIPKVQNVHGHQTKDHSPAKVPPTTAPPKSH
jgi:hypothetical protein